MDTGKLLAIKTIQLMGSESNKQREIKNIKNEIDNLKVLNHVNIIKYFYTDQSPDSPNSVNIILEFAPGGSIRSLLDKFVSFDEKLVKIYTH